MTKKGSNAVFGIFQTRTGVEDAIEKLKESGFRNSDVSVLMSSPHGNDDFGHIKTTKVPEGTATGATSGALLGGGLGWLAGIGALAIPGFGPFVAAGPIMAALAGLGVGGAVGGIAGALIGWGIPEFEAKRYQDHVKNGGILLSVHVDDSAWGDKAEDILKVCGATDVAVAGEESSGSTQKYYGEANAPRSRP